MDADEIVMHKKDRDRVRAVVSLFRRPVGQPREPPHRQVDGQVVLLDVARRDVLRAGLQVQPNVFVPWICAGLYRPAGCGTSL